MNLAGGGKHWTKDEIEKRKEQEAKVPKAVKLTCPKWLCPEAAKLFRAYAKELIASTLPVSRLDTGTLARLCDAEFAYGEASRHRNAYLAICSRVLAEAEGQELAASPGGNQGANQMEAYGQAQEYVAYWTGIMGKLEKVARGAANDLGCTVSSRCRMVVPKAEDDEEENPLERLRLLREGAV